MILVEFDTFQYGAGLVFVITWVMSSTRPTRVFTRASVGSFISVPTQDKSTKLHITCTFTTYILSPFWAPWSCLLLRHFDLSLKHASSEHENLGTSTRGIARERKRETSGNEVAPGSVPCWHNSNILLLQVFSRRQTFDQNTKVNYFNFFCPNCCYQTGSDPGDRASQAWSSLIIVSGFLCLQWTTVSM